MFELRLINGRKSFYGKCHVNDYVTDGEHFYDLVSYSTRVASYNATTKEMSVYGWYSMTTASHINAFLYHFGYDTANKKIMEDWNARELQKKHAIA